MSDVVTDALSLARQATSDDVSTPPHVAVVGVGIAGVSAAAVLADAGVSVDVFDMGENPGGRLAVRDLADPPWPGHIVDVGASHFTVTEPEFAERVQMWQQQGLAHQWSDTFAVVEGGNTRVETGRMRWSAASGLRSLARAEVSRIEQTGAGRIHLAHKVSSVAVADGDAVVDGQRYSAAVLACPQPQALRILDPETTTALREQLQSEWNPVISHTMVFTDREWPDHGLWFINGSPVLTSVADDGARRGDRAAVLVAHSTPDVARAHFDDPESAADLLTAATQHALGIAATPVTTITKRWGLAHPAAETPGEFAADPSGRVFACGDGWAQPARIEGAWLSGRRAAQALVARLRG